MLNKLMKNDNVECPHCYHKYTEFECKVQDFVIPGKVGEASTETHECEYCDKSFQVTHMGNGEYLVEAI